MREKTLDLTVDEWMGMYHIAADRADKAEAEVVRLRLMVKSITGGLDECVETVHFLEAEVERLTAENCPNCGANMALEDSAKEQLQKELAQLAIESVEREKALAKLEAEVAVWAQAEADGRLVELPCKVGDTVWVIASCEDVAKSCDDDYFNGTGEITCPYENTCEIEECADDNIRVFETSINCVVIEEDGKFTFWVDTLLISFGVSKIGKTVFLTREEAEAAHLCSEFEDAMDTLKQALAELDGEGER
jgi:hypothetical protein